MRTPCGKGTLECYAAEGGKRIYEEVETASSSRWAVEEASRCPISGRRCSLSLRGSCSDQAPFENCSNRRRRRGREAGLKRHYHPRRARVQFLRAHFPRSRIGPQYRRWIAALRLLRPAAR